VKRFGKKKGQLITAIAHNMHTFRHYVRIGNYHEARTHAEFFFTLYGLWQKGITDYKTWHQAYLSLIKGDLKKRMLASIYISSNPEFTLYRDLLSSSDFKDVRYLLRFGIYVDPKTGNWLSSLPNIHKKTCANWQSITFRLSRMPSNARITAMRTSSMPVWDIPWAWKGWD
jgi:hypothetical protein